MSVEIKVKNIILFPVVLALGLVASEVISQSDKPVLTLKDSLLINPSINKFLDTPLNNEIAKSIASVAILYLKNQKDTVVAHTFFTQQKNEYFLRTSSQNVKLFNQYPSQQLYLPFRKEWITLNQLKWNKESGSTFSSKLTSEHILLNVLKKAEKIGLIHISNTNVKRKISVEESLLYTPSLTNFGSITTSIIRVNKSTLRLEDFIGLSTSHSSGAPIFVVSADHYEVVAIHEGCTEDTETCTKGSLISLLPNVTLK